MNKRDGLLIVGALVGGLLAYRIIMWLIVDKQIDPIWLSIIIAYITLVYPQYQALYGLKLVSYAEEGYDTFGVTANKRNAIIFVQDIDLLNYFGFDEMWKKIVGGLNALSIPVMVISILYVNLLVIFIDFGADFTVFMMYLMLISIMVYIITKTIIIMYFINMFGSFTQMLVGLIYPFGLFMLNHLIKHYFHNKRSIQIEDAMGANYD